MKSLLIETHLFEGKIKEDDGGRTLVKGVLQRAGAENQNGRVYPKPILEREAKKYLTFIKERRALGELDHPDSTVINLKNVSHNIKEIWWEGDDFELIGWDFVSNPSTHGAFMVPMNESVNPLKQIGTDVCGEYCKAQDLMREIITEIV